jgi:hypothetical protein
MDTKKVDRFASTKSDGERRIAYKQMVAESESHFKESMKKAGSLNSKSDEQTKTTQNEPQPNDQKKPPMSVNQNTEQKAQPKQDKRPTVTLSFGM